MNPNSNSLFHFTSKISVFKKILKNGLRYSFAFEAFPESIINNVVFSGFSSATIEDVESLEQGFAMPMISFCDIPLTRVNSHSKRYGKYAIGISKDFLCDIYKDFINPVFYADSPSIYESINTLSLAHGIALRSLLSQLINNDDEDVKKMCEYLIKNSPKAKEQTKLLPLELQNLLNTTIDLNFAINVIVSLLKPTYGVNIENKKQCFYDEREWRAVMPNYPDSPFEKQWCISREEFKSMRDKLNNRLNQEENAFITIPSHWFNQINHIIVPKEKDIVGITDFICSSKTLFGQDDFVEEEKLHLITKITSFERIADDY